MQGGDIPRGYIVCNADEMEPGTFKDRLLMEQQPHLLIEGMILAAFANNARYGYIFLRGEYVESARVLSEALLNSLEGQRANPRAKPPFPGQSGAWGKPTVVNNVETLCNAPAVMLRGADWYQGLSGDGTDDGGTKLYGASGLVNRPGLWELPIGTTGGELLELAGGLRDGKKLKAWLPGGASTGFLLPEHLDLPLDFDTVARKAAALAPA